MSAAASKRPFDSSLGDPLSSSKIQRSSQADPSPAEKPDAAADGSKTAGVEAGARNPRAQRYLVAVEYVGTRFSGSQQQPNQRTVVGVLEEAFHKFIGQPVSIFCSSRTDAGVHALSNVCHVDVERISKRKPGEVLPPHDHEPGVVKRAVNHFLQKNEGDIMVTDVCSVAPDFHARYKALERTYHYRLLSGPEPLSVFEKNSAWHIPEDLNVQAMKKACSILVGYHDFSSFRAAGCQVARKIYLQDGRPTGSTALNLSPPRRTSRASLPFFLFLSFSILFFSGIKMRFGRIFSAFYTWHTVAISTGDRFLSPFQLAIGSWTGDRCGQGPYRQLNWRQGLISANSPMRTLDEFTVTEVFPSMFFPSSLERSQMESSDGSLVYSRTSVMESSGKGSDTSNTTSGKSGSDSGQEFGKRLRHRCFVVTARARSFLYHQVRLMVGLLKSVGTGDLTSADVERILNSKTVTTAPPMAPACGLYLADVKYDLSV